MPWYQPRGSNHYTADNYNALFEAAHVVRDEASQYRDWNFSVRYDDFQFPQSLSCLIKWIIAGPKDGCEQIIERAIRNTTQIIMSSMKTPRQVNYHPNKILTGHSWMELKRHSVLAWLFMFTRKLVTVR